MPTKIAAWLLSFLSIFALWKPNAQPNRIPETRGYQGEVPDQYGIWPTKEFTEGEICSLVPALLEARYAIKEIFNSKTDSLLILHRGELVYERYAEGWDKDKVHPMYSVTKSVVSALVGIAIKEGKIKGVDQKVIDFFPDAKIAPGQENKRDMTIEHLLTMTSGLPGDDDDVDWNWWDAKDTGKAAFETPQQYAPGERYSYSSGAGSQTLACLVSRAVKKNLYVYAKEKLFKPLGMTSVKWETAEDGRNLGGFGISMTSRDMLRFGYLYLNHGRWDTQQILPAQWVAVTPPKSKAVKAYGYMFWNFPLLPLDSSFEANGAYGQFIEILPEWDMVIVRTGTQNRFNKGLDQVGQWLGLS